MKKQPVANLTIRFDAQPGCPEASLTDWIEYVNMALREQARVGAPPPMYADFKIIDARLIKS